MKRQRRAKGEGAFHQRADGRWQFAIDTDKYETGRRRRRYITAGTSAALARKVADERARNGGTFQPPVPDTIASLVTTFLAEKRDVVSRSTSASWERAWGHVKPLVTTKRLDKFGCEQVAQIRLALTKKLGTRSIQIVWQLMALSFDLAIRRSRYFRPNPWRVEKAPKHQTKEIRILRQDEVARFVSATAKDRFEALWLLCLFCGLRLGEALGLTLDAIDWKTGEIQIRQQVTEVNGVAAVGKPKTAESIRSIYADPIVLDALRRRRKVALKEGHGSPYLFTTTTGHFISRTNLRSRHFAKVCERAEITGLTIHSLRHKFTSEAVDKGKSLIAVAQYLGHRSTRMVTDRYGWHRQEHQQRAVAEAVAEGILSIASGGMGTQGQPASAE